MNRPIAVVWKNSFRANHFRSDIKNGPYKNKKQKETSAFYFLVRQYARLRHGRFFNPHVPARSLNASAC